jgi:hypothetical protein
VADRRVAMKGPAIVSALTPSALPASAAVLLVARPLLLLLAVRPSPLLLVAPRLLR